MSKREPTPPEGPEPRRGDEAPSLYGCGGPCCRHHLEWCVPLREEAWDFILQTAGPLLGPVGRLTRNPQTLLVEWHEACTLTPCLLAPGDLVALEGDILLQPKAFSVAYAAVERTADALNRSFWFGSGSPGYSFRLLFPQAEQALCFQAMAEDAMRLEDFQAHELRTMEDDAAPRLGSPTGAMNSCWQAKWLRAEHGLMRHCAPVDGGQLFAMLEALCREGLPVTLTVFSHGVRHQARFRPEGRTVAGEVCRCWGDRVEWHLQSPRADQLWQVSAYLPVAAPPYLKCLDESGRHAWRLQLSADSTGAEATGWREILNILAL